MRIVIWILQDHYWTSSHVGILCFFNLKGDAEERVRVPRDLNDLAGEGNIENMLLVDKGLRELASLKVFTFHYMIMTKAFLTAHLFLFSITSFLMISIYIVKRPPFCC